MSRPTIKDIARAAGVSPALVSFALNDQPGVSREKRELIHEVARTLGYAANPIARELRTGASNVYALVVRNLQNPFFNALITGAQEAASRVNATIVVADSAYSVEREENHIRHLAARRVAGLAIAPVGPGDALRIWNRLRPDTASVVINAEVPDHPGAIRIQPNNDDAVTLAVRHLAERGHRRIALFSAPRGLAADHDRTRVFQTRCAELGIATEVIEVALESAHVYASALAYFSRAAYATAIIANSDYVAHSIYRAARSSEVVMGRDIAVIGHDDLETAALLDPPLTSVAVDRAAMGAEVFRALVGDRRESFFAPVALHVRSSSDASFEGRV